MDAIATTGDLPVVKLLRSGMEELGVPGERYANYSAIL
jgi:hypothetical protein